MANDITLTQPDLIKRLLDNLPAGYTSATVKLPNAPFDTPSNTKWLRASVLFNETDSVTPDNYKRTFGFFIVDLFNPKGSGDRAQLADAKTIQDLFNDKEFGNTRTYSASIISGLEEDAWFKLQVSVEFLFEGV